MTQGPGAQSRSAWISLAAVCALVIGIYAYMAEPGILELLSPNPADSSYNLLVQGFRAGQLSLKKEVPPGLAQLADPYDPTANEVYKGWPYRMLDMSYYKGRLYLYWGVTPALILFWPYNVVTGEYLFHRQAVTIFCAIGFLASVGLLRALWRRYFANVSVVVVAACALALGLATGMPMLLSQSDVYEVAISCGYMLTMLALAAIWKALHEPKRRWQWLATASAISGLAVGARPSLLFGGIILLAPVVQAWRERRQMWAVRMAAIVPITLIGLGLMLYNQLRFGNALEFGWHYQLTWERQITRQMFSPRFLWFNFCVYFLGPARWSTGFPFVHDASVPPWPVGYAQVTRPFGVLTNIPLVWLALAAPLAWRSRSGQPNRVLPLFVAGAALLFGVCALTLGVFCTSNFRYEVDFLPTLLLLAVVGIFGLERELAPTSKSGQAGRAVWRRAARGGWGLLLGFSVAFNLLATVAHYAEVHNYLGNALEQLDRWPEAVGEYEQARRLQPDFAEAHYNLGFALQKTGNLPEAIGEYQQALRLQPDFARGHNDLGTALWRVGKVPEAIREYEEALRINPNLAETHYNLGTALEQVGRVPEAIAQYQQALRIRPNFTQAQNALARLQAGR